MITNKVENFTAQVAIEAGLYEALKRGETKISGSYDFDAEGYIEFKQQNFVFKDKFGELRVGKFKNADDVIEFMNLLHEDEKSTWY